MSTLRNAVVKASNDADARQDRRDDWYATFIQSLRQSGYWIAPVDATPGMLPADVLGVDKESSFAAMRDAYIKESGQ